MSEINVTPLVDVMLVLLIIFMVTAPLLVAGVPIDLQPNVFERFARGDNARSRAGGSTGLGLSIVAAVTRAHGGQVEMSSKPGDTTFALLLPSA